MHPNALPSDSNAAWQQVLFHFIFVNRLSITLRWPFLLAAFFQRAPFVLLERLFFSPLWRVFLEPVRIYFFVSLEISLP